MQVFNYQPIDSKELRWQLHLDTDHHVNSVPDVDCDCVVRITDANGQTQHSIMRWCEDYGAFIDYDGECPYRNNEDWLTVEFLQLETVNKVEVN